MPQNHHQCHVTLYHRVTIYKCHIIPMPQTLTITVTLSPCPRSTNYHRQIIPMPQSLIITVILSRPRHQLSQSHYPHAPDSPPIIVKFSLCPRVTYCHCLIIPMPKSHQLSLSHYPHVQVTNYHSRISTCPRHQLSLSHYPHVPDSPTIIVKLYQCPRVTYYHCKINPISQGHHLLLSHYPHVQEPLSITITLSPCPRVTITVTLSPCPTHQLSLSHYPHAPVTKYHCHIILMP